MTTVACGAKGYEELLPFAMFSFLEFFFFSLL